ncbi:Proline iminopeptidase, partial [Hyphodiscus hymeniophilus]
SLDQHCNIHNGRQCSDPSPPHDIQWPKSHPPPSVSDFDSTFGGYLPPGTSIISSWGVTRYYEFPPQLGPPKRRIIIIHGGGTCAIGMAPLGFKLAEAGNHVVIYDIWGHGLSSTPLEAHTPALMHAQLLELLAHLGWGKAHLLGFSIGGCIGATFTARHPEAVESFVNIAGAGLWRRSERSWWDGLVLDGGWGLEGMSRRKILNFVHGDNPQVSPDWKERMLKGDVDTEPVEKWEREYHKGHVASLVSLWRCCCYDQHDDYRKLVSGDVPSLVILAEKDGAFPLEFMRKEFSGLDWKGEIKVVSGATHNVVRSHVKEVVDLVGAFWGSLEK